MARSDFAFAALVVVSVTLATLTHQQATERTENDDYERVQYLPSVTTAKFMALGHRSALADMYWIRAALYFANETHDGGSFRWLDHLINLVIELDPQFKDIYTWAGAILVIKQEKIEREHVELGNAVLDRGIQQFPDDWRLPLSAMANCAYYLSGDENAEFSKACRRKYVRIAASKPGAPFYLPLLLLQDSEDPVERTRACDILEQMYLVKTDPTMRRQVEARMTAGFCKQRSRGQLRRYDEAFNEAYAHFDYLPDDLKPHVGETSSLADELETSR